MHVELGARVMPGVMWQCFDYKMKRIRRPLVSILLTIFLATAVPKPVFCQNSAHEEILSRRVTSALAHDFSISSAFSLILTNVQLPGGVAEVSEYPTEAKPIPFPSGVTLRDALNSLVGTEPEYSWRIEEGVVNLLPNARDLSLLNARLPEFRAENVTVREALSAVLAMPEVKTRAAEFGLTDRCLQLLVGGRTRSEQNETRFNFRYTDLTMREALNAIVRAQRGGTWYYKEYYSDFDGKRCYRVEFIS